MATERTRPIVEMKDRDAVEPASEERPTEEAIAKRKLPPRIGPGLAGLLRGLEQERPDLAAQAPVSSAAVEAGDLVRSWRRAANWSQRQLADAAGLQQSAVSALERGEGKDGPSYRKLRVIANALGMRVAFVPRGEPADVRSARAGPPMSATGERAAQAASVSIALERLVPAAALPPGLDLAHANLLLVGPGRVMRENSPGRRSFVRVVPGGGFIRGGRFTDEAQVRLVDNEEVEIVNTGDEVMIAIELPEAASDLLGAGAGTVPSAAEDS